MQRGPDGAFVFVVQQGGETVAVRPVSVAQQDDVQAVISTGLQAGDQIVTTGFAQLADGTRVRVTVGDGMQPRPLRPDGGRRQNRPANPEGVAPGTAANPPASTTRPARQQRSSTGAAASPAP